MARNVEIKARVADAAKLANEVRERATDGPRELIQHDTFFRASHGRLKLRRFADGRGELIAYRRADAAGPRTSHYRVVPCPDPAAVESALAEALGIVGVVDKRRTLYRIGRTRVHLDRVVGLGDFVELEVVLREDEPESAGEREAAELMEALGIDRSALVAQAYVDLLERPGGRRPGEDPSVYSPPDDQA